MQFLELESTASNIALEQICPIDFIEPDRLSADGEDAILAFCGQAPLDTSQPSQQLASGFATALSSDAVDNQNCDGSFLTYNLIHWLPHSVSRTGQRSTRPSCGSVHDTCTQVLMQRESDQGNRFA